MGTKKKQCLIALLLLGSSSSYAHHAFSPVYDGERTITVAGTVTEFRFVNPHTHMTLDVVDEQGNAVVWNVEFDGVLNLTNDGWSQDTIPVGSQVTVTGNPTHTGSLSMFFVRLEFADGRTLTRPIVERLDTIEAERRRRREQRGN